MRMTLYTKIVLATLATGGEYYGYQLCEVTGIGASTIYPVLGRLEEADLVESVRRDNPDGENLPRRRYYSLTRKGATAAAQVELPNFAKLATAT